MADLSPEPRAPAPKIVFVNRYFYPDQSATSQLLTDLAGALANTGFDVHVICSRQRYDDAGARLIPHETVARVTVRRVWTTRFGRAGLLGRALDYATFYGSSALALLRFLKRNDTVVAKTDPPLLSIVAMVAARLKGAVLINWLQDLFPEVASLLGANPLPHAIDALLRRCRDRSLRSASANVVLGERMRDRVLQAGVLPERIHIIENWAELKPDAPKPVAQSALRSRLGLDEEFVVGYSGNLGRAHDFKTLLDAAVLLKADARFVFLMIGGGAGMQQLAREVEGRGLASFRFLPYQPRESLSDCLAAADVHWVSLRPSLEGYIVPSKFYGILAAARPVAFVGDPDGELARDIRRCACGGTVEPGQSAQLAELFRVWAEDVGLRARMGRNAHAQYVDHYSATRAFNHWTRILAPA